MSEQTSSLQLITQPIYGTLDMRHYANPDTRLDAPIYANVVQAIVLPDGNSVENPDHLAMQIGEPVEELRTESITLLTPKAKRLVKLFESLRSGHDLECHDLVSQVEGWEYDKGPELTQRGVQPADQIESGSPYTVLIARGTGSDPDYGRTHSAIGTDQGRLLGILARGLVLATMTPDATRRVYANGAPLSYLAKTILPAE